MTIQARQRQLPPGPSGQGIFELLTSRSTVTLGKLTLGKMALAAAFLVIATNPSFASPSASGEKEPLAQPRAAAYSPDFELVVLKAQDQLVLFLDDFTTNEPIAGASLMVEAEGTLGAVREIAPGIYAADWKLPAAREGTDVAVDIVTAAGSERLVAQLVLPASTPEPGALGLALGSLSPNLAFLLLLLGFAVGAASSCLLRRRHDGERSKARTNRMDGTVGTAVATS